MNRSIQSLNDPLTLFVCQTIENYKNSYSREMTCLISYSLGNWGWKVTCPKGEPTRSRQMEPCFHDHRNKIHHHNHAHLSDMNGDYCKLNLSNLLYLFPLTHMYHVIFLQWDFDCNFKTRGWWCRTMPHMCITQPMLLGTCTWYKWPYSSQHLMRSNECISLIKMMTVAHFLFLFIFRIHTQEWVCSSNCEPECWMPSEYHYKAQIRNSYEVHNGSKYHSGYNACATAWYENPKTHWEK